MERGHRVAVLTEEHSETVDGLARVHEDDALADGHRVQNLGEPRLLRERRRGHEGDPAGHPGNEQGLGYNF